LFDVIIVGTGASSTAAALELQDKKLLIIDVGIEVSKSLKTDKSIFDLKRSDKNQRDYLIGKNFESLANIRSKDLVSVKLKAPLTSFVIENSDNLIKIKSDNFSPFLSYAYGGLSNAWGAGVYRYTDYDLKKFPISSAELEPFYNKLTDLIGISGENDDLQPFFGNIRDLQKPLKLNINCNYLYSSYLKRKKYFLKKGISVGRTQLTVLTEEKDNRPAYNYNNTSFFTCKNPSIYTPVISMDQLKQKPNVTFKRGFIVETFEEKNNFVQVNAIEIKNRKEVSFIGKKLLLGAGTINTGKIILQSFKDYKTRLPILDNPISFIPFVNLRAIGSKTDQFGYEGGQLILIYEGHLSSERVQGSLYSYISPLRSDIFFDFPLSIKGNLSLTKFIVPGVTILQLFYPDTPKKQNYIQLKKDKTLFINYTDVPVLGKLERHIIKNFWMTGFITMPFLVQYPRPGNSIHYAGTIPMNKNNANYFVDKYCCLNRAKNVYLIDGSVFPVLPAKNLTFTLMANAMRIARLIRDKI